MKIKSVEIIKKAISCNEYSFWYHVQSYFNAFNSMRTDQYITELIRKGCEFMMSTLQVGGSMLMAYKLILKS